MPDGLRYLNLQVKVRRRYLPSFLKPKNLMALTGFMSTMIQPLKSTKIKRLNEMSKRRLAIAIKAMRYGGIPSPVVVSKIVINGDFT